MQLKNRKLPRFILLGLSLCIILFSFLQFFKWRQVREIEIRWQQMQEEWRQNACAVTEYEFGKITHELLACASRAVEDLKSSQRSDPNLPVSSAFFSIMQGETAGECTFELVDSTGHIQAWSGRSVRMQIPCLRTDFRFYFTAYGIATSNIPHDLACRFPRGPFFSMSANR